MDWNNTPVLDSIQLPGSNTKYWMKDTEAREKIEALVSATHFLGVTTTALTDGATTNPITINNAEVTAVSGDIAIYKKNIGLQEPLSLEFIFDGTYWQLLGGQSIEGAGALAYKDSASGSYTPAGSVTLSTTNQGEGDIDVLTDVETNFYVNLGITRYDERAEGFAVLTSISASDVTVVTDVSTSTVSTGSRTDAGSLPTLTGVVVSGLTASISNTTLVFDTGDSFTSVSYSFNSGVFPTYSFASVTEVTSVSTGHADYNVTGDSTTIYATIGPDGNYLSKTYSGVTGTFAGSSATITVS